jgi:hypothetical protein
MDADDVERLTGLELEPYQRMVISDAVVSVDGVELPDYTTWAITTTVPDFCARFFQNSGPDVLGSYRVIDEWMVTGPPDVKEAVCDTPPADALEAVLRAGEPLPRQTVHLPVEPTEANGWNAWWCPDCRTDCAASDPCGCCTGNGPEDAIPD